MKILHISDIHYRSTYTGGNLYEDMLMGMSSPFLRLQSMMDQVLSKFKIDLIVVTGDLCDDGTDQDYKTLKKYMDSLNIPTIVTLGNHDDKKAFYKGWLNQESNEPYMDKFEIDGYSFLSFDNSAYGEAEGCVNEERLMWLKENVSKNTIVLTHHQFQDEPGIPKLKDGEKLLNVLKQKPPIAVLNGHTHWIKQMVLENIPVFTAPSLCFRAINEDDGSIVFSEAEGYCVYSLEDEKLTVLEAKEKEHQQLSVWKF